MKKSGRNVSYSLWILASYLTKCGVNNDDTNLCFLAMLPLSLHYEKDYEKQCLSLIHFYKKTRRVGLSGLVIGSYISDYRDYCFFFSHADSKPMGDIPVALTTIYCTIHGSDMCFAGVTTPSIIFQHTETLWSIPHHYSKVQS